MDDCEGRVIFCEKIILTEYSHEYESTLIGFSSDDYSAAKLAHSPRVMVDIHDGHFSKDTISKMINGDYSLELWIVHKEN
jgi:hypothetical protein